MVTITLCDLCREPVGNTSGYYYVLLGDKGTQRQSVSLSVSAIIRAEDKKDFCDKCLKGLMKKVED